MDTPERPLALPGNGTKKPPSDRRRFSFEAGSRRFSEKIHRDGEVRATREKSKHGIIHIVRDVAQLVARAAGGGEAAGSSPVIPTKSKTSRDRDVFDFY